MRKIFEQGGKCCLRLKRNTFNLLGWGKSYSRLKRTAFTLAEVLIVLGIIGIVASMTIPTLMNKVAKQEYIAGLKKFYSTQMNGYAQLLADEGVQKLEDTSVFQSMTSNCYIPSANFTYCNNLKKYFRFTVVTAPSYQTYYLKGTKRTDYTGTPVLAFADGSIMFNEWFKKPNTWGRDIFYFELSGDGKLYPSGGKDESLFYLGETWQKDSSACGK